MDDETVFASTARARPASADLIEGLGPAGPDRFRGGGVDEGRRRTAG